MMEQYGRTVARHRATPQHLTELAGYVRREFGPGTGLGYLVRELEASGSRPGRSARASLADVVRTVVRAVRSLVSPADGGPEAPNPEPAR